MDYKIIAIIVGIIIGLCFVFFYVKGTKETVKNIVLPNKISYEYPVPTKYRIEPIESHLAEVFLQFEVIKITEHPDGTKDTNSIWKFIPSDDFYVSDKYLSQNSAPEKLPNYHIYFIKGFWSSFEYEAKKFMKTYPNIQLYFDMMLEKHKNYLQRKEEARKRKTLYLN